MFIKQFMGLFLTKIESGSDVRRRRRPGPSVAPPGARRPRGASSSTTVVCDVP